MSTAIIGPVSLRIMEKNDTRILLFSDIHGNVEKPDRLQNNKIHDQHKKVYNLDDYILTFMQNNSRNSKKTDLYIEASCYTVKCSRGNEYVGTSIADRSGWLEYVFNTTENAKSLTNCRIHHIDTRKNEELGFLDVLTWSGRLMQELIMSRSPLTIGSTTIIGTPVCVILELLDVITVLVDNAENIWSMYCNPFGFRNVLKVIEALEDLNKEGFSKAARSVISLMTRYATSRRAVNEEIKQIQMHKIALQHYKLLNTNKETAECNYTFLKGKYNDILQSMKDDNLIEKTKNMLKGYNSSLPIFEVPCLKELADIVLCIIKSSAYFMDMYAISRLLYNKSDDIIIFAGVAHINTYYELLHKHEFKITLESNQSNNDRIVYVNDVF